MTRVFFLPEEAFDAEMLRAIRCSETGKTFGVGRKNAAVEVGKFEQIC